MKTFWNIFSILAVIGTYYGAWQHNWIIIISCFIPQAMTIAYKIAKEVK